MPVLGTHSPDGSFTLRAVTRANLPEGDVPSEGRLLTPQQVNDAVAMASNAMSRRVGVPRAERELGQEALQHLVGHIVAQANALRASS